MKTADKTSQLDSLINTIAQLFPGKKGRIDWLACKKQKPDLMSELLALGSRQTVWNRTYYLRKHGLLATAVSQEVTPGRRRTSGATKARIAAGQRKAWAGRRNGKTHLDQPEPAPRAAAASNGVPWMNPLDRCPRCQFNLAAFIKAYNAVVELEG